MIEGNIADLKTVEDVNNYYSEMGKKNHVWNSAYYEKQKLTERIKELEIEFDRESKTFKSKSEEVKEESKQEYK